MRKAGGATFEGRLVRGLLERIGMPPLRVVLWNGEEILPASAFPVASVRLHSRATLFRLLLDPELWFGECYSDGRIEVEGDLVALLEAVNRDLSEPGPAARSFRRLLRARKIITAYFRIPSSRHLRPLLNREFLDVAQTTPADSFNRHDRIWRKSGRELWQAILSQAPRGWPKQDRRSARDNIHRHYDLGNEFYRLWLDSRMVYTCAYFERPELTLDQAQKAKLERVCCKLGLRAGETVVEAGCGWGSLALYMARHYDVSVRAYNISHEQILHARKQAEQEGLGARVSFVEEDYRSISGSYDVFVSVGMLEHVGRRQYRELGRIIRRCLTKSGRGLIHAIGRNRPLPTNPWIARHIFPGGYTPSLAEMMDVFEPNGLAVLDVENLRPHYAATLEHWLARYECAVEPIREMFDEHFVRMWRLYLASALASFRTGWLELFQVLFSVARSNSLRWTRGQGFSRG